VLDPEILIKRLDQEKLKVSEEGMEAIVLTSEVAMDFSYEDILF
jgi:hypothetical protein